MNDHNRSIKVAQAAAGYILGLFVRGNRIFVNPENGGNRLALI
jgi:hypothetical protein